MSTSKAAPSAKVATTLNSERPRRTSARPEGSLLGLLLQWVSRQFKVCHSVEKPLRINGAGLDGLPPQVPGLSCLIQYKAKYGLDFGRNRIFGPHLPNAHGGYGAIGSGVSVVGHRQHRRAFERCLLTLAQPLAASSTSTFQRRKAMALLSSVVRDVSKHDKAVSPEVACCWTAKDKTGDVKLYSDRGRLVENGEYVPAIVTGISMALIMASVEPVKREMISAIMEGRQSDYDKVLMSIGTKIEMTSSDKF